jgi:hypothetical protein
MNAFGNNPLTNISLPSSLTTIDQNAFRRNQLSRVVVPKSVKNLHAEAFDSDVIITRE